MSNAELVKLVSQVNASLALVTWPFVIYDVFSKSAPVNDLRSNLAIRRGQLLNLVTERIETALQPFWPKTTSVIIVEPDYRIETTSVFSDAAADAVRECLSRAESLLSRAARARSLAAFILLLDRVTYWLVYITGLQSLICLLVWFFASSMSDLAARMAVVSPLATASASLIAAGIRQIYHHKAQREIADELANS